MSVAASNPSSPIDQAPVRRAVEGDSAAVFTEIYEDDVNMVIWRRDLAAPLRDAAAALLHGQPQLQNMIPVSADDAVGELAAKFDSSNVEPLARDFAELVDMFCCLFDLPETGLRLAALDRAMCPKFHVDRVPCRLVTTYTGVGTEWLPHANVVHTGPGRIEPLEPDVDSPDFYTRNQIQTLAAGDVALLKGELWPGNEQGGAAHRSPMPPAGHRRLVMTLDCLGSG